MRFTLIALLPALQFKLTAASNEKTIQYIFDKHEAECIAEQYEVLTAKEGETPQVTVDLELDDDNLYEIMIDSNGKTATVLHANFSCTGIGYAWCGTSGCDSYVIVDGVSYTSRGGKPMSIDVGGWYVVLIPRRGSACHNSLEIGTSNAAPCYTAAVWDSSANKFSSYAYNDYILKISPFEP